MSIFTNQTFYLLDGFPVHESRWPSEKPKPEPFLDDAIDDPKGLRVHWGTYKDYRRQEYPPIGDQLDILFKTLKHLQDNGLDIGTDGANYIATIEAVKNKYPKAK